MLKKIKNYLNKNEKYLSPIALLGGFIIDTLTLRRIDLLAENILIIFYLLLALFSIFILNFSHAGYFKHKIFYKSEAFFSLLLQFVFGGLFSVFFVFYFRSSGLFTSWIFLIFLFGLLVGNEIFRENYKKFSFQISIFFVSLFSYSVFLVPLLTKKISKVNFLYSGLFSLLFILIILYLLYVFFPKRFLLNRNSALKSILSIYLVFNVLYFVNAIPPIPLSLKEAEIVHELKKVADDYEVSFEKSVSKFSGKTSKEFSWIDGEPIYLFTSIFSPTKINLNIFHDWYFFNESSGEWELRSSLDFFVTGGRDGGYRGYSYKYKLEEGAWRVKIVNGIGQILGVKNFRIKKVEKPPELQKEIW